MFLKSLGILVSNALNILATGTTPTVVTSSDWQAVLDALTAQINVGAIVGVIAAVISAGIGLVFMWFGVRKLLGSIMTAFKKGKLKV